MSALNRAATTIGLKAVIGELDYDLAKSLYHDEETGEDAWDEWVDKFIDTYGTAVAGV